MSSGSASWCCLSLGVLVRKLQLTGWRLEVGEPAQVVECALRVPLRRSTGAFGAVAAAGHGPSFCEYGAGRSSVSASGWRGRPLRVIMGSFFDLGGCLDRGSGRYLPDLSGRLVVWEVDTSQVGRNLGVTYWPRAVSLGVTTGRTSVAEAIFNRRAGEGADHFFVSVSAEDRSGGRLVRCGAR